MISDHQPGLVINYLLLSPYRFYFDKLYNKDTKEFLELPPNAEHYGTKKSGKGKGGKGM